MFILLGIFAFFTVVQLVFILFIFTKVVNFSIQNPTHDDTSLEGVSVVIAAWNELENLQQLLPILDSQDHPKFEIIIMDDRSWDGSFDFLNQELSAFKHARFIRIDETPNHISSKKYALSRGIMAAQYDIVLLTDADCRPTSEQWIRTMQHSLEADKDIVLGASPYYELTGFLNKAIRFETFYTALQYLSLALAGAPYMGVGRNLMYRKHIFVENKGFAEHNKVIGGDDDLFINRVATSHNTAVCMHPDAATYSFPKETFKEWLHQKRRHLSVGKFYAFKNRFTLGLLSMSQIGFWVFFGVLFGLNLFNIPFIWYVLGIFALRFLSHWIVLNLANNKLYKQTASWSLPVFDFLFTIYYFCMGILVVFTKKKKLKWR
jgi:glycosyltransferase involved in cell wall biosynthesis